MGEKPKLAVYWGAACGGCEISLCNTHETLLEIGDFFDFCFCPALLDTKKEAVESWPDGAIALTLFNGNLRTSDNLEMAQLLRRKSKLLVAFGSCAHEGCVPGLGNLVSREETLRRVYQDQATAEPGALPPAREIRVREGVLHLPILLDRVYSLGQAVPIDYVMPGCPPEPHQITAVMKAVMSGAQLPPPGSVLGAGRSTVCEECTKRREQKRVKELRRVHEVIPDPDLCLLEQGLVCMGVATRDGCGALCPKVDMPCIGCYGPPDGVLDQGAKMAATLGSILDIEPLKAQAEGAPMDAAADRAFSSIPDWVGTMYKFSLADALLGRSKAGPKEAAATAAANFKAAQR
jgi:F420-non-reducing hydrogenase small subunit